MNFAATSVFETANWKLGSAAYEVTLLSEHGGPVTTSLGNEIQTSSFKRRTFDTLIVASTRAGSLRPLLKLNFFVSAYLYDEFAGRLPRFQILLCLGDFFQWVDLSDPQFQ
jgi:hypothetical protein